MLSRPPRTFESVRYYKASVFSFKQSKTLHATGRKLRTYKPLRHAALNKTKKVVEEKSPTTGKIVMVGLN